MSVDELTDSCVRNRNFYHFTFILISQFNRSLGAIDRRGLLDYNIRPEKSDFKDTAQYMFDTIENYDGDGSYMGYLYGDDEGIDKKIAKIFDIIMAGGNKNVQVKLKEFGRLVEINDLTDEQIVTIVRAWS